uniref:Uncharacterized protein n=1 Tax=Panagrolaimus sp. PS1159 TaxID=55785 RepID=A0AC35GNS3_9BILA
MPVPFYIRYLVLCKDTNVTKFRILKIYGFILALTVLLYFVCIFCCWPFPETYERYAPALQTKFWLDEYIGGPKFCAIHPGNIRLIMAFGAMCSCSVVSYFLIIYFSVKIIRHLSQSHIHMSKRTKQLNKQLLKTLAVQAIGPLVTGNFPMCCTIIMIFLQYENHYVTLGLSCLLGWVAVINPIAATLIIKPYRKRVKELLRFKRGNITSILETPSIAATKPNSTNIYTFNAVSVNPVHDNMFA